MSEYALTELASMIATRDGLDPSQTEEVQNRLRRLRDQRAIRTIEGSGGRGRGKSAMLTYEEAARALVLETLAPQDMARDATDKALAAFDYIDPSLPGAKASGLIRHLPALQSALRGIAKGEPWVLRFRLMSDKGGRSYSARIFRELPEEQQSIAESERIMKASLKADGVRLLAVTRIDLSEILAPLVKAEKAK